jgi:hypothetical protein
VKEQWYGMREFAVADPEWGDFVIAKSPYFLAG